MGLYVGVLGCARVHEGVLGCAGVCGAAQERVGVCLPDRHVRGRKEGTCHECQYTHDGQRDAPVASTVPLCTACQSMVRSSPLTPRLGDCRK